MTGTDWYKISGRDGQTTAVVRMTHFQVIFISIVQVKEQNTVQ